LRFFCFYINYFFGLSIFGRPKGSLPRCRSSRIAFFLFLNQLFLRPFNFLGDQKVPSRVAALRVLRFFVFKSIISSAFQFFGRPKGSRPPGVARFFFCFVLLFLNIHYFFLQFLAKMSHFSPMSFTSIIRPQFVGQTTGLLAVFDPKPANVVKLSELSVPHFPFT
jgi:hypothetical protein